ncbi:hypothetical protein SAMN05216344_110131 [Polaromonas sp. OV174]|nr:hypothetical protein SAMN05216344_110131 [Polaromonas sp. OV174]
MRQRRHIWFRGLLPNEPRILYLSAEAELTRKYLQPSLTQLEACLLAVRVGLDPELRHLRPVKLGKPYPLGQCLEIAQAVEQRLRVVTESSLPADAANGLRALRAFQRAGGTFRQVWGDLRGQYFQNAFQVGTLYVDVANDTVTPTKPKVEILPFDEAQFFPIRDFGHFRQIARRYWGDEVYPNHVLPKLAPHCPLINVSKPGRIKLHDATQYMLSMTRTQAFVPSEEVLRDAPMPEALFEQICRTLKGAGHALPRSPDHGRTLALQQCRLQRSKRWYQEPARVEEVIEDAQQVNLRLARWHHATQIRNPPLQDKPMPSIKIDNIDYDLDSLSIEARAQLQSIQFVDQELARLQAQVAAMQTARNAYVNALKAALPVVAGGDTIKLS